MVSGEEVAGGLGLRRGRAVAGQRVHAALGCEWLQNGTIMVV